MDGHFEAYLHSSNRKLVLEDYHLAAIHKIRSCQTSRLGEYYFSCEGCGLTKCLARSCKHRFCSRCGAADTHRWAEKMLSRLLDIKHHHVVASLPKALRHISKLNGSKLHDLLFYASSYVLKDWFSYKHGMKCGIVSVLHTNGSDLKYHPHVHMIVSGGGLVAGKVKVLAQDYLCKQEYLGRQFKRVFVSKLMAMYDKGLLKVSSRIRNRIDLLKLISGIAVGRKNWVVQVEKPLEGVSRLVRYVGRYTKRSCISERRIKEVSKGLVRYEYKDYEKSKRGGKLEYSELEVSITAFLDRLLQHVPPPGYKVVRYMGMYATSELSKLPSAYRHKKSDKEEIDLIFTTEDILGFEQYRQSVARRTGKDPLRCYECDRLLKLIYLVYEKKGKDRVVICQDYEDSS